MAVIHPFKAWKPDPDSAENVACVPYDVISADEARELAEGKPDSFLHIIRPEIDLPENTPFNADKVYEQGKASLENFIDREVLQQDEEEAIYIYRLVQNNKAQSGIFTCVSVEDYDNEVILKHELTRPDKEDDRTRHILTQSAHAEPVMMTFKDTQQISEQMEEYQHKKDPLFNFIAEDDVQHTIWKITDTSPLIKAFSNIRNLYIADGHHRCKSASRAAAERRKKNQNHTGEEEYNFFPAVLFPMNQMEIMAYNRVIHQIPDDFSDTLQSRFDLSSGADPVPSKKGNISIYLDGSWHGLKLPVAENPSSVEKLDVFRLQEHLLEPLLSISDPRTDNNISFVGGIRGTQELEKLVDNGKADLAISMYPTSIEELMEVSDEGLLMPPKSTWFEPKLRSGLLIHTF